MNKGQGPTTVQCRERKRKKEKRKKIKFQNQYQGYHEVPQKEPSDPTVLFWVPHGTLDIGFAKMNFYLQISKYI